MLPQLVRQHQLKQHAAAKVKGGLGIVPIHQILRHVVLIGCCVVGGADAGRRAMILRGECLLGGRSFFGG